MHYCRGFYLTMIFLMHAFFAPAQAAKSTPLTGLWRIISFEDLDSTSGQWTHPYGSHPSGYIYYSENGVMMVNVSTDTVLKITEAGAKNYSFILQDFNYHNAFGYFGGYTMDAKNAKVIHHVTGGSMPWYTGTDQERIFHIRGDTLIIGDPLTERRIFVKEK